MPALTFPLTWDLVSLSPAPTTAGFREELDRFKAKLAQFAAATNELPGVDAQGENVTRWVTLIAEYERLDAQATDLKALVECYMAADAECKAYHQLQAELSTLTPYREQIATNIEFALKEATDADFLALLAASPELKRNEYFLVTRRKNAALRLPKSQELLAADLAVDGIHAWGRLFDRLSTRLSYSFYYFSYWMIYFLFYYSQ